MSWPPSRTRPVRTRRRRTSSATTFGAHLVQPRDGGPGADLVLVAKLMGHTRLETTRAYTRPTAEDRAKALDLLPVDR